MDILKSGTHESSLFKLAVCFLKRFLRQLEHELWTSIDVQWHTNLDHDSKVGQRSFFPGFSFPDGRKPVELHLHELYLEHSHPQRALTPGTPLCTEKRNTFLDVAGCIAELAADSIKMIKVHLEPISEILSLLENSIEVLLHPVCLSKDSKVFHIGCPHDLIGSHRSIQS